MNLFNSFSVFVIICAISTECNSYQAYIHNGQVAVKQYPFMAFLLIAKANNPSSTGVCAGTLIRRHWILTAAHCVDKSADNLVIVYLGSSYVFDGTPIKSKKIIMHENYDPKSLDNDIALIRLVDDAPAHLKPIQIASEVSSTGYGGQKVLALGWGETEHRKTSRKLNQGYIKLIKAKPSWNAQLNTTARLFAEIIPMYAPSVGFGDSGGPIILENDDVQDIQVGLISMITYVPYWWNYWWYTIKVNIFTDVSYYNEWIHENMQD